jgi:hypothetical protein
MRSFKRDLQVLDERERDLDRSDQGMILRMPRRRANLGRAALNVATLLFGVGVLGAAAVVAGGFLIVEALVSVAGFVVRLGAGWQWVCAGTGSALVSGTRGGRSSRERANRNRTAGAILVGWPNGRNEMSDEPPRSQFHPQG